MDSSEVFRREDPADINVLLDFLQGKEPLEVPASVGVVNGDSLKLWTREKTPEPPQESRSVVVFISSKLKSLVRSV